MNSEVSKNNSINDKKIKYINEKKDFNNLPQNEVFVQTKQLFNPHGDDDIKKRNLINGDGTNLFTLLHVKYDWARQLYFTMMQNFWIPEKINLVDDRIDYENMLDSERQVFDNVVSSLVFLDSLQTNNLPNVYQDITASEVYTDIVIQSFQEVIHSESYNYIISNLVPVEKFDSYFDNWKKNEVLLRRNQFLVNEFQSYANMKTDKNFFRVLIADYILEGISFYVGFYIFYSFSFRGKKLLGVTDIIRLIHRDELTHVQLFQNLINTFVSENGKIIPDEQIYSLFATAVTNEIDWIKNVLKDSDFNYFTLEEAEMFIKYLANICLGNINLKPMYENVSNPFTLLEKLSGLSHTGVKSNFFETNVTSYNMSSAIHWDENVVVSDEEF